MESKPRRKIPEFTSRLSNWECFGALIWLPVHLGVLPLLMSLLIAAGYIDATNANFICYAAGAVYMLLALGRYLRREFDPLWDAPLHVASEIATAYLIMMFFNMGVNMLLGLIDGSGLASSLENPNNQAVFAMAEGDFGKVSAMTIFLAPIVEELMFRSGVFGLLRRFNRTAAYAASMLLFSVYHVWAYAIYEPAAWLYVLQYLPISWLLCRCYERCNTIWASIFLHMLINGISMQALQLLGQMA